MTQPVTFWLNDQPIETDAPDGLLVLDYLRRQRLLTGTKEGCKEGDCGACSILLGDLNDGRVVYTPVTSCLVPVGELHGRHLVSIEGLNLPSGLNPVQQAMVDRCGSQCGFCTPGFIVSMCWYMLGSPDHKPTLQGFQRAFSGNLCRCTGYASINRASLDLVDRFSEGGDLHHVWTADDRVAALCDAGLLPTYFTSIADHLATIAPLDEEPMDRLEEADFFVAGGTDLYVQKGEHLPRTTVKILNRHPEMKGIDRLDDDGIFRVGALTTFEEFGHHPDIQAIIPRIQDYLFLIASLPLRIRATLSGNIINASPIGDMTALLLAMDSTLVFDNGDRRRPVPMKRFFKGYKIFDKEPDELMTEIHFPIPEPGTKIHFEKVSKRKCLDIATVNSAASLRADEQGVLRHVSLTLGGVAAIPLYLKETSEFLLGQPLTTDVVLDALRIAQGEISPISDVRGSADYKRLLAHQLLCAHFTEHFSHRVSPEALLAS